MKKDDVSTLSRLGDHSFKYKASLKKMDFVLFLVLIGRDMGELVPYQGINKPGSVLIKTNPYGLRNIIKALIECSGMY